METILYTENLQGFRDLTDSRDRGSADDNRPLLATADVDDSSGSVVVLWLYLEQ